MFASRSLAESGLRPVLYVSNREDAGRRAIKRAGRSYVITWKVRKHPDGSESLVERRAHHPDDLADVATS
jgi:hypothetical protein